MEKDFENWNKVKQDINKRDIQKNLFFHEREVWWGSLGVNIGVEIDGKNENFERPVLIIKKFNGLMVWVLPMTSKTKSGEYYFEVNHDQGVSWVALSQIRIISTKRLIRKIGMIKEQEFSDILSKIKKYLE